MILKYKDLSSQVIIGGNLKTEEFAHYYASLAQRAVLYEVSTTPKPGLVDRDNNGAHKDMDFYTFMASSSVLYRGFYECILEGLFFNEEDGTKLLDNIRKPGLHCEKAMFQATNGVNTHKGMIFSMGILCAAVGKLYGKDKNSNLTILNLCNEVKAMAKNLTAKDFENIHNKTELTHGEKLYKDFGLKGIRGEVESGFSTIQKNVLPLLMKWKVSKHLPLNELFIEILFRLMAENDDTNVITRAGIEGLQYTKDTAKAFLAQGGTCQPGFKEKIEDINKNFIEKNISPGGSADLLSVSIFLAMIEGFLF